MGTRVSETKARIRGLKFASQRGASPGIREKKQLEELERKLQKGKEEKRVED